MYLIGEVSRLTGIPASTLRYYEKIGLLPKPERSDGKDKGIRNYNDQDLRFIRFLHGLKHTGMKLEDIATFTEDGCLLTQNNQDRVTNTILHKRIDILDTHIEQLEQQMKLLKNVITTARDKREFYINMLKD